MAEPLPDSVVPENAKPVSDRRSTSVVPTFPSFVEGESEEESSSPPHDVRSAADVEASRRREAVVKVRMRDSIELDI